MTFSDPIYFETYFEINSPTILQVYMRCFQVNLRLQRNNRASELIFIPSYVFKLTITRRYRIVLLRVPVSTILNRQL